MTTNILILTLSIRCFGAGYNTHTPHVCSRSHAQACPSAGPVGAGPRRVRPAQSLTSYRPCRQASLSFPLDATNYARDRIERELRAVLRCSPGPAAWATDASGGTWASSWRVPGWGFCVNLFDTRQALAAAWLRGEVLIEAISLGSENRALTDFLSKRSVQISFVFAECCQPAWLLASDAKSLDS